MQEQKEIDDLDDADDQALRKYGQPPGMAIAEVDFGTCNSNVLTRHHRVPRTKLYVPSDEACPYPLKWLDIFRHTETSLDHLREHDIKDYWNVDKAKPL